MKRTSLILVVCSLLVLAGSASFSGDGGGRCDRKRASDFPHKPFPWEIGGGDVPIPYAFILEKFDLAAEESYVLAGQVVADPDGEGYQLRLDLDLQPWLATKTRKKYPYVPVKWNNGNLDTYVGREVRVEVVAKSTKRRLMGRSVDLVVTAIPQGLDLSKEKECRDMLQSMSEER